MVSKWSTASTSLEYRIFLTSQRLVFNVRGPASGSSDARTAVVSPNTWYFFVAWHDSVNNQTGIQLDAASPTMISYSGGVQDTPTQFVLGGRSDAGAAAFLNGRLDEVGFWKRVLTASERGALYNNGAGRPYLNLTASEKTSLVSWWALNELSGLRADWHGSNSLTDHNSVATEQGKY
jgi:hypothetical protein